MSDQSSQSLQNFQTLPLRTADTVTSNLVPKFAFPSDLQPSKSFTSTIDATLSSKRKASASIFKQNYSESLTAGQSFPGATKKQRNVDMSDYWQSWEEYLNCPSPEPYRPVLNQYEREIVAIMSTSPDAATVGSSVVLPCVSPSPHLFSSFKFHQMSTPAPASFRI